MKHRDNMDLPCGQHFSPLKDPYRESPPDGVFYSIALVELKWNTIAFLIVNTSSSHPNI